jgi:hypothetical protein
MSRLRWALILPLIQVAIATAVFQWDSRMVPPRGVDLWVSPRIVVLRALNAPALLIRAVAFSFGPTETGPGWIPRQILGFYADDFFFLIGVAITWALVGRALDRRNSPPAKGWRATALVLVRSVLLAGLGSVLFFVAKDEFERRFNPGPNIAPFLALAWSISLIYLAVRGFIRMRQAGRQGLGERPDPCVRGI